MDKEMGREMSEEMDYKTDKQIDTHNGGWVDKQMHTQINRQLNG